MSLLDSAPKDVVKEIFASFLKAKDLKSIYLLMLTSPRYESLGWAFLKPKIASKEVEQAIDKMLQTMPFSEVNKVLAYFERLERRS